jgi:prepilin-type N-terminal cleavage/methylation domain-containing protein
MPLKKSDNHGFTLIELMVVVVIIGILAALAIPRYFQSAVKSKQGEAKLVLKQICTNQMLYRASNPANQYWGGGGVASSTNRLAFAPIDVEIAANARYEYRITLIGNDFEAEARANLDDDATEDVWTIRSSGALVSVSDDSRL